MTLVIPFFLFGLLIIGLSVVGARLGKRSAAAPVQRVMQELGARPGDPFVEHDGRSFTATYLPGGKNTPPALKITASVDEVGGAHALGAYRETNRERVDVRPAIVLRRETRIDRFGKRIGLNREIQTGDAELDRAVYVETDAPEDDVTRTLADERFRRAVCLLLDRGAHRIELDPSGLSATQYMRGGALGETRAQDTVALLTDAASALPLFSAGRAQKAASQLALVVPFILGTVVWPFLIAAGGKGPIDTGASLTGVGLGLVLWALLVVGLAVLLRGKSSSLRRVGFLAFATLLAVPSATRSAILYVNRDLDASPAVEHAAAITRVYTTQGKHTTYYHVEVASWRQGEATISLDVSSSFANQAHKGSKMIVTTHAGKLGWEWVESFRLAS